MSDKPSSSASGASIQVEFDTALSQRYLAYALSTITSRSLPDVRDGLKPVHRRLLYAMRQLRLDPGQGYKKSARVVGDVMGKFHPHGDAAIYDSMVRLAQEFVMRYPLVDGQGNFGNIDGDNAAAMRYTEARMSDVSRLLLEGIDEDAVDFRPTYDGESAEPIILPSAFPNLLANGAQGIAVGMATSIPPHNILELADAAMHLLKHPNASDETLLGYIKGPDLPTGGVLVEDRESMLESYRTGRGSFRVRAQWEVETESRGAWKIVVVSIPYQVQKSRLVERMAEMLQEKKLPMLGDIRDESAEDLRLVLEPKSRQIDPVVMMETLFKLTDLETKVPLNLNVLTPAGKPAVLSLKSALLEWIEHRLVVLNRRGRFRLGKIAARLEVLEGYLVVYLNLDEVIAIIREEDAPREALMARFELNQNQADAILDMRLRALRKLEEVEIQRERKKLIAEQASLSKLLEDEAAQRQTITQDMKALKATFSKSGVRRTHHGTIPVIDDDALDMLVEKEPVTIICSAKGWIRMARGHLAPDAEIKFKEGDGPAFRFNAETTDKIIIVADNGRFFTLNADKLPSARGFGEPVSLMVELGADTSIISVFVVKDDLHILIAAENGYGFIVPVAQVMAQTRLGKQVINLGTGVKAVVARPVLGDTIAVVGDNRKLLIFPREELPVMSRGRGVRLQKYRDGGLADACCFTLADGLSWQQGGRTRTEADTQPWQGKRSGSGKSVPKGFPRKVQFSDGD